jgi:hypothetical protein
MSLKTLMFLTSSLATAGMVVGPLAAQADGMSQLGTWGKPAGMGAGVSNLTCDGVPGVGSMNIRQMNLPRTPGVNTNTSAFRPNAAPGVNANIGGGNVSGNIGMSKPLWPAPGFEDTEIMVFDRSGGVGWRDVGIRASTS